MGSTEPILPLFKAGICILSLHFCATWQRSTCSRERRNIHLLFKLMLQDLIFEALNRPTPAIAYYVNRQLAAAFPERPLLSGSDCAFNLLAYANAGLCTLAFHATVPSQIATAWNALLQIPEQQPENAAYTVAWEGYYLEVLLLRWRE